MIPPRQKYSSYISRMAPRKRSALNNWIPIEALQGISKHTLTVLGYVGGTWAIHKGIVVALGDDNWVSWLATIGEQLVFLSAFVRLAFLVVFESVEVIVSKWNNRNNNAILFIGITL
jgi:hypothetical protein